MYNGPSGPRILLTMEISSAHTVAANIAPTPQQIILLTLILIPFRLTVHLSIAPPSVSSKKLTVARQLTLDSVFELQFVLSAVEMAIRFADEPGVIKLPPFVAADANAFSQKVHVPVFGAMISCRL